jgi:hypothetical protein
MRLLQLNPDGTEESALDLHPIITVINGLGVGGRDAVIRAVTAIARGQNPGIGGLVEAHGVMLDLTPETLALLDLGADLDVLVRSDDIPIGSPVQNAPAMGRVSAEQFLRTAPPGRYPVLDEARRGQADAAEALAVLSDAAERARNEHGQAVRHLERALAELEQATAASDATRSVVFESEDLGPMNEQELSAHRTDLVGQIEQLRSDLDRIERGLLELSAIDTRPIQVLLDAIAKPDEVEYVPSERAHELADEFVRLQAAAAELEHRLKVEGRDPASAEQRLEAARAELQQAERGIAKPDLSADDVAELEAVHEEVLEAERRASGRFNRGGKRNLEEAAAKQQAVLDRVGFPTWSAYVMGAGLLAIDPAAEQRLEKARFEFEAAEANWTQISQSIEQDPEHSALLDRLEAVYLEAFDLLGGQEPENLEAALRAHTEAKREVTTSELVDALAYQLELVGLDLGEAASLDRTVVVAEAFLAETSGLNARVEELEAERHNVAGALAEAEAEFQSLPLDDGKAGGLIDLTAPTRREPVEYTAEDVAALEAALAEAAATERAANERMEAREALVDAATQVHAVATSKLMRIATELAERPGAGNEGAEPVFEVPVDDPGADDGQETIEFYLLARLAALRNVSFAGAVPMVVDDAFSSLSAEDVRGVLSRLEKMADAVQIIYLTDDRTVTDWATEVGFQRAAVVEAAAPFR